MCSFPRAETRTIVYVCHKILKFEYYFLFFKVFLFFLFAFMASAKVSNIYDVRAKIVQNKTSDKIEYYIRTIDKIAETIKMRSYCELK